MGQASTQCTPPYLAHLEADGGYQCLKSHLLSVSEYAGRLSAKIGLGPAGETIGILHDLGKYSQSFQEYVRRVVLAGNSGPHGSERGSVDHSTAGAQRVWQTLRKRSKIDSLVAEILSLCIASHHSGLIDCVDPQGGDNLSKRMTKPDSASHYEEAWAQAEQDIINRAEVLLNNPELVLCVRNTIEAVCHSNDNETLRRFKIGLLVRLLFSCLIDADRTDTADSSKPAAAVLRQHGRYVEWEALARLLRVALEKLPESGRIDQIRKAISIECLAAAGRPKGILTLTVPTGGGKTLASLRFALAHAERWKMDHIIYASPYISIVDQNAEVVRKILEPPGVEFASILLEHHSNLAPLEETRKSKLLVENWDAPVIFTTAVQLFETLFGAGTRAVRRMHQLANSILIFDEAQTIPVRCVHLFNNAMNFLVEHCGATVLLCTATQPLLHQVDSTRGAVHLSEASELVRDVPALFANFKPYVAYDCRKSGGWQHHEVAEMAVSEARGSGSCLVVVNTKSEARSIFTMCKEQAKGYAVYHLSTNMCPAHRLHALAQIRRHLDAQKELKEHKPVICLSTQLIEAGVDIDFGTVIRALAGLDSIAQAAGRCNRHGSRKTIGKVHIVNIVGELHPSLHDIKAGQEAAQRVLDELATAKGQKTIDVSDPTVIEHYFRYYFFDRKNEMAYTVGPPQAERDDNLLNMLSENGLAVETAKRGRSVPQIFLRQSFMSAAKAFHAIDGSTQGIIAPYSDEGKAVIADVCAAYEVEKQFKLLKRAQQFTVNADQRVIAELQRLNAVNEAQVGTGILCLDERYYSPDFGLSLDRTEEMGFCNA